MERNPPLDLKGAQTERGTALLVTLIGLALIGYLARQLFSSALAYSRLVDSANSGLNEQSASRLSVSSLPITTRGCKQQSIASKTIALCSLGYAPLTTRPSLSLPAGRINYNALLEPSEPCPGVKSSNSKRVFTTPEATHNCLLAPELASTLRVAENIEIERGTPLADSSTKIISLNTPGSFRVRESLNLSRSTLIVAGGEVSIAALKNISESEVLAVTIVSAHGTISVDALDQSIALLTIGRGAVSAPPSRPSLDFPMPAFIDAGFSGVSAQ